MDCSPPGSPVHGILHARILEWAAVSFSRGSSQPRNQTCISWVFCIGRQILYHRAMCKAPLKISIRSTHSLSLWKTQCHQLSVFVNPQQALFTFHGHMQLQVMLLLTWLSYTFSFHSKWAVLQTHGINPDLKLCPFTWCPNRNNKYTCMWVAHTHTHTDTHKFIMRILWA